MTRLLALASMALLSLAACSGPGAEPSGDTYSARPNYGGSAPAYSGGTAMPSTGAEPGPGSPPTNPSATTPP